MDKQLLVNILKFAPLGLFLFFIIIYLLWGLVRGFRKSLVLFIHALVIGLILFAIYEIVLNQPGFDNFVYNTSKQWVDYTKEPFYASAEATTMNEVISSAIVHNVDYGEGVELIIKDNGAYLATLANLVFHLAMAIVFFVVYLLLVFIMYIVYLIFYPERRRARKIRRKHEQGEGKPYNRHTGLGGIVGALRGLCVSLIWLSFIGAVLFIAAGTGDDRDDGYNSVDFSDNTVDSVYEAFDIINCYGSTGVFKVLNTVKDSNNVPVYLFAANMVLQGSYTEPETNEKYNLYLLRELNNYQEFASGIYRILIEYDTENQLSHLSGKTDQEVLDVFISIISKDGVQARIDKLIDNFDGNSFFVNFGLSMVDSIANNLEKLKFYEDIEDQQLKDLLHLLLKGDENGNGAITISNLLTKDDTKLLANAVIKALKAQTEYEGELDDAQRVILYTEAVIDDIKEMSFIKDDTKKLKTGAVLKNLYTFASTSIDTEYDLTGIDLTPTEWVGELESLLDAAKPALQLYNSVYNKDLEPLEMLENVFPEDNPELSAANEQRLDVLINTLSKSNLLDAVMSLSAMRKMIDDALAQVDSNIQLPSKIQYVDKGEERGEAYHLLTSLKQLIKTGALSAIIDVSKNQNKDNLSKLADALIQKDSSGKTVVETAVESTIVKYVISGVVLNLNVEGFEIVVPDSSIEVDEEDIRLIKTSELNNTVEALPGILEVIKDTDNIDFAKLLEQADELLESNIIEATLIYNLVEMIKDNEYIVIPDTFKNAATKEALNDLENNVWHTSKEINNVIDALDELLEISKSESFVLDDATKNITKNVFKLNTASITDETKDELNNPKYTRLDVAYRSEILKASISKVLDDNIADLMDASVMTNEILVETDTYGVKYYKQSELSKVLYGVEELGFEDLDSFNEDSLKDILSMKLNDKGTTSFALANNYTKVQVLYSSYFVKAILAKQVDTYLTEDIIDVNVRDSKLVKEVDHGITIYKESEIVAVADIITEIAVTDFDKIADKVMDIIFNLNDVSTIDTSRTKLQVLYSSNLVKSAILKQLDDNLGEDLVSTDLRDSTLVKEAKATEKLDGTAVTFYLYKESELSNIVRAANELGIETMDDLNDTSKISDKIFTLFEKSTSDPTKEKIEIIYESNIIKSVVSTQLDNNLDSTLIDVNVRDSIYVKEALNITKIDGTAKTIYLYQKDEIRNIIDGANELDINSLDDFTNADKIKDKIFTLSDAAKKDSTKQKIDILNESYIVRGVLAKQLDDNLGDTLIDSTIRDSKLVKDFENVELVTGSNADIALYSTTEIKAIINSAKELDISKIDDFTDTSVIKGKIFTLNDAATTTTGTKLDVLYSSNIVIGVLAKQLDGNLGDTIIDQELRDSKLIKEILVAEQQDGTNLNTYIYKKVEISYIIDGANELGIESIDDFTDSSVIKGKIFTLDEQAASDNTKQKLDILYQSNIVKGVLAKQLDTNLTSSIMNEDIRDSKLVKDFEATTKISNTDEVIAGFYKKTEILQIIKSADELGFDNIDDLTDTNKVKNKLFTLNDPATTTTGKKIDVLLSSNIIRSVLAVQLDENIGDTIVDLKVRDSLLVKEKITAEKANGTNAYVYLYTNDEVKTIISSAKELDITSVDDFTNFDVIKGKIFTLSDQAVTDNTKKKMEVLYSSNIIKSILTKQLDTNLDESIISVDVKNSELTKDKVEAVQLDNSSVNVYLYKETEVYGIINSAKELDITTVADFNNSDTIKNKIFTLYDTAVTDNSKSKIEVMYASFIIKSAFTKQLDDNLDSGMIDANVLDSRLVKHKYETISTSGTDIVCNLYEDSEVYGIINSARELEITSIDNLDGDNVKNKILTLNGPSLTDSTKSKLDILYTSYIIRSAVSTQLDNTLGDGNTADLGVLNSRLVKEKKATTKVSTDEATKFDFYIKDEISILIVSLDEIGITNISSFNSASVKNNVLHLNEQAKSDNTRTKLDVIYGSYIIQSAILKQLDTYLDDTFMNIDVRDSRLVKTGLDTYDLGDVAKTVSLYTQSEVRHLIDSATELDITTLDGFDADSVKDKIMNLNDESITDAPNTKLDVLYQSNIIQSVITTQIDSNIGSTLVADSVKDSTAAKSTYATYDLDDNDIVVALYKKYEVSSLINALDIIGITDISSVDTDTVGDSVFSLDDAKLTELYKSVIITYALSKKLDESFVNLNADTALLNEKKSNEFSANGVDYYMSTNKYYLKSEVLLIINAIGADGLGKSSLADVEAIDANVILGLNEIPAGKTKTRLEVIYESDILKNIVSDKLDTALDSNTAIVNDPIAKYDLLDLALYVYKIHEIEVLIDCLNHFGVTDIDTVDASTLALDNTFKGYVLDSSILFSTVSKQIIDNDDLVRPSRSLVTQNVITKVSSDEEMTHILNALIKLGVTDVTASISISLNSNIITEVSTSDILRATVTDKILANNVIVYVTNVKDATITDKTVITSEEMTAFLTAITDGFGMSDVEINSFTSADLALPAKADPDLDDKLDILASSVIMRATITSKLELQNNSYEDYDIYTLEDNADVYYNKNNDQVVSLKKIELVNTMKGVVYLTDGGTVQAQFSLATLAGLSDSELQIVLASGMFRIVTDALLDTYPAITMGKVQVSENMYLVSDCTSKVDNILTAEDEYEIIVNARAYLSTL